MSKLLGRTSALALVLVAGAALAGPPIPISECGTTITEPGKYRLMNDLVGCASDGIRIVSSDVTLDLNGHGISCDTQGRTLRLGGVSVWTFDLSTLSNVTVKNGHVSSCSDGVFLAFAEDSEIKNVSSSHNLAWDGASGTGITVWFTENIRITKNHTFANELQGIAVWDSAGILVKHNLATSNYGGIWVERVGAAEVSCNQTYGNGTGVLLGPWTTDSLVKGNVARWNWFDGISAWGWTWNDGSWADIAAGNTFRHNVSQDNLFSDHLELAYNVESGAIFPHPDGECRNRWFENQFATSWGPDGCIGPPVALDDADVCAFDTD